MSTRLALLLALLFGLAAMLAPPLSAQTASDFPVPGGWFYTQASIRPGAFFGYSVVDDFDALMWTEYRRLGGPELLGYPVSRRYVGADGFIYQGFERFVLQWQPDQERAVIANVYEQFTSAGLDDWLVAHGIPKPQALDRAALEDEIRERTSWLTEVRLLSFYLLNPALQKPWHFYEQAWDSYGLPQSGPERLYRVTPGRPALWPFIAQRFQKVAFQLWLEDGPGGIARHSIAIASGGTLARQAGLIPITAALPEPPPSSTPWLVGQPQLLGPSIEIGKARHFALGGSGFTPGETVTVTLTPLPDQDEEPLRTSVTLSTRARPDGSFVLEGDAVYGSYSVSAFGRESGVAAQDVLNLN